MKTSPNDLISFQKKTLVQFQELNSCIRNTMTKQLMFSQIQSREAEARGFNRYIQSKLFKAFDDIQAAIKKFHPKVCDIRQQQWYQYDYLILEYSLNLWNEKSGSMKTILKQHNRALSGYPKAIDQTQNDTAPTYVTDFQLLQDINIERFGRLFSRKKIKMKSDATSILCKIYAEIKLNKMPLLIKQNNHRKEPIQLENLAKFSLSQIYIGSPIRLLLKS